MEENRTKLIGVARKAFAASGFAAASAAKHRTLARDRSRSMAWGLCQDSRIVPDRRNREQYALAGGWPSADSVTKRCSMRSYLKHDGPKRKLKGRRNMSLNWLKSVTMVLAFWLSASAQASVSPGPVTPPGP